MIHRHRQSGFTLIELVVVLAVLAALAGLVLPLIDSQNLEATNKCSTVSMTELRDVIMGKGGEQGYVSDMGALPAYINDLFDNSFIASTNPLKKFNINSKRGWHGPYVCATGAQYVVDTSRNFPAPGPTSYARTLNDFAVPDSWGNPIVLYTRFNNSFVNSVCAADDIEFAQLVSAGPDGRLATDDDLTVDLRRVKVK